MYNSLRESFSFAGENRTYKQNIRNEFDRLTKREEIIKSRINEINDLLKQ